MRTAAVALALALTAAPAAAQDAVTLKWSLKQGDTFYTRSVTDMDMDMMVMGQSIDIKMKVDAVQRMKVTAVKGDTTTVELTILQMEMTAEGGPGGGAIPGLGAIGERVKGAAITATLDKDMTVTKLEGYDKFLDKLAGGDEAMRKQMKAQFSEATIGQMFSQVFSIAPSKPVKPGDTWDRTDKMTAGGLDAVVKQKYKLDSVSGGVAKVGLTADLTFKAGAGLPGLPPGITVDKFDLKADKFTGTLLFDTKAGRLTENKTEAVMNGAITLSAMGQKVDMTMKIKMKQAATVTDRNPIKD